MHLGSLRSFDDSMQDLLGDVDKLVRLRTDLVIVQEHQCG